MNRIITLLVACLGFLAVPAILHADLNEGLVAYYPFNGNANDESGNGHDGTALGATLVDDRFGDADSAYHFDGINDLVVVPDDPDFTVSDVSIVAWIKTTDKSDHKHIFSCYGLGYNSEMVSSVLPQRCRLCSVANRSWRNSNTNSP